ncbi:MAG TPA: protoheme IX farnesyltransferase [Aigarchaeota archaeon]|nr:protoheme IX farnesyltransferase [Aigarchaeota archaeon]
MMNAKDLSTLLKPKIAFLNVLTGVAGYVLAGGEGVRLLFFIVAGFLTAMGSGAVNHYLDRDIDARMQRTADRPIPKRRIKPSEALLIGMGMIVSGVMLSLLTLTPLATFFIALGAFIYLVIYTIWLKRRTVWNIVIGGAAGSCPPLAGWAAVTNSIDLIPVLLAFLIFLWTPGHFWGLAIRAERDYRRAGIPMLPAVAGIERASFVTGLSNMITVAVWFAIGLLLQNPLFYFIITTPLTVLLAKDSVKLMMKPEKETAWRVFKTSSPWLMIIVVGALASLISFPSPF